MSAPLSLLLAILAACGSARQEAAVRAAPPDARRAAILVDLIDARAGGTAPGRTGRRSSERLAAHAIEIRAHAERVGVVLAGEPGEPAPRDASELEALMLATASHGAEELVFVREHLAREHGGCAVVVLELVAVDPRSRDVLVEDGSLRHTCRPGMRAATESNAIRLGPLDSALHDAIEDVLATLVRSRGAGHPSRRHAGDLADAILARPPTHVEDEEARLMGAGWSMALLPGWSPAVGLGASLGGLRAEDGTFASVVLEPTARSTDDFAAENVAMLHRIGTILREGTSSFGHRPASELEVRFPDGTRAIQRMAAVDGLGIVVSCVAAEPLLARHRSECFRLLDSVRFPLPWSRPPPRVIAPEGPRVAL